MSWISQTGRMPHRQQPLLTALAGLAALAVAMGIGRFAFTPILPMMQQDVGLSVAAGGWLASANYVGYLLGALTVARARIGAGAAIRGSLVVIGLVTLGMALTGNFVAWLVLRLLAGMASAMGSTSRNAMPKRNAASVTGSVAPIT